MAGRLFDGLARLYGRGLVFKDVDNLRPGDDFGIRIKSVLGQCRYVLVLIGPTWAAKSGLDRLNDPEDWVRREIEEALSASHVTLVPVLINGAVIGDVSVLPKSIRPLFDRHAATIRRDPDFSDDLRRLVGTLRGAPRRTGRDEASRRTKLLVFSMAAAALLFSVLAVAVWLRPGTQVIGRTIPTIAEFRASYPEYRDLSDDDLARRLHRRFYDDMSFEDFARRVGVDPGVVMATGVRRVTFEGREYSFPANAGDDEVAEALDQHVRPIEGRWVDEGLDCGLATEFSVGEGQRLQMTFADGTSASEGIIARNRIWTEHGIPLADEIDTGDARYRRHDYRLTITTFDGTQRVLTYCR